MSYPYISARRTGAKSCRCSTAWHVLPTRRAVARSLGVYPWAIPIRIGAAGAREAGIPAMPRPHHAAPAPARHQPVARHAAPGRDPRLLLPSMDPQLRRVRSPALRQRFQPLQPLQPLQARQRAPAIPPVMGEHAPHPTPHAAAPAPGAPPNTAIRGATPSLRRRPVRALRAASRPPHCLPGRIPALVGAVAPTGAARCRHHHQRRWSI